MTDYYFEKLNSHVIHIDIIEDEVKQLWAEYMKQSENKPDFLMWCVFLAKKGIRFYCWNDSVIMKKDPNIVRV